MHLSISFDLFSCILGILLVFFIVCYPRLFLSHHVHHPRDSFCLLYCIGSPVTRYCTLLGLPLAEHILQQHPKYLVASFDIENQTQFWGSFIELVLNFLPLILLLEYLFSSDVVGTWIGLQLF